MDHGILIIQNISESHKSYINILYSQRSTVNRQLLEKFYIDVRFYFYFHFSRID